MDDTLKGTEKRKKEQEKEQEKVAQTAVSNPARFPFHFFSGQN
jgi:hypothetical protein